MKKYLLVLIAFANFAVGWNLVAAESTAGETPTAPKRAQAHTNIEDSSTLSLAGSVLPRDPNRQTESLDYPLFRPHASKYYPPKTARTATLLSATLPGLGQTYSGRPVRGLAFLAAGVGLIAAGGFHLERAVNYNDLSNRFNTGFYDSRSNRFLSKDQMRVKARSHTQFGALFLAGGIGVYIWNIFDAAKTTNQYNERRFPVQVQQNVYGETHLTVNRRF